MIQAIEITARDGVVLRGEVAMRASDWIALVHAPGDDLDAWKPLSRQLEDHHLTVLAVDLRGHGGSGGAKDSAAIETDLEAMLEYARAHMALRVFVAAAGASAQPALALAERTPLDGLVLISPTGVAEVTGNATVPRLTLHDPTRSDQAKSAERLAEAPGWSLVISLPEARSAREIVQGEWSENAAGYVLAFLREVRLRHPDRLQREE